MSSQFVTLDLHNNSFSGELPSYMRTWKSLTFLDLSDNNFSGKLPAWIGQNFTYLKILILRSNKFHGSIPSIIDLSSNRLTGNFPYQILNLTGLVSLNLSRNSWNGRLPRDIGHLNELESLDLSRNQFSGEIPTSMSDLHFLSFDASVYIGNEALCGPPLTPNCSSEDPPSNETVEDEIRKWFYVGLGPGFVAGFGGFCGVLAFNRAWRYAFFSALYKSFDWLLLKVALLRVRLSQRSQI
ncbi:hypothetical protein UlMin_000105 [Ulmus minor]